MNRERVSPIIFACWVLAAGDFCFHLAEEWLEQFALDMRERFYHAMARGNQGPIFQDDKDRRHFLETLAEACQKTGWRIHPYVLMGNHYHLLVETPEPNLVAGMDNCLHRSLMNSVLTPSSSLHHLAELLGCQIGTVCNAGHRESVDRIVAGDSETSFAVRHQYAYPR